MFTCCAHNLWEVEMKPGSFHSFVAPDGRVALTRFQRLALYTSGPRQVPATKIAGKAAMGA